MKLFRILFIFTLCLSTYFADAQKNKKVKLLYADSLIGGRYKGEEINKLIGNVRLEHEGSLMFCDSAYQYKDRNMLAAFQNVRIERGDTLSLKGDTLYYNSNSQLAKMRGNVVMRDTTTVLRTDKLNFDIPKDIIYYFDRGTIIDQSTQLTSKNGTYDTKKNYYVFQDSVRVLGKDSKIVTDTLHYSSITKIAYLKGPSTVYYKEKKLYAEDGIYDTRGDISQFRKNAFLETPEYYLKGDSLYYDENLQYGHAFHNAHLFSKKDSVIIEGEYLFRWGQEGRSKVYENAVMKRIFSQDTLYLFADTIVSVSDTAQTGTIHAYKNVKVLKSNISARSDSLVFQFADSTLYLYQDPVVWQDKNQISADTIRAELIDGNIKTLYADLNAFMISQDTLLHFNQVKGRDMVAHFKENKLNKVFVEGNGESLYFAIQDDSLFTGMNDIECSRMRLDFKENDMQNITFLTRPDAKFIPPKQLKEPETRLKDFRWRIDERPEKSILIEKYSNQSIPLYNKPLE